MVIVNKLQFIKVDKVECRLTKNYDLTNKQKQWKQIR